jgi:hypothetical protein
MSNNRKDVYTIKTRGEKNYWVKIGSAFVNKDASLNVYLDAMPLSGELNIRDTKVKNADQK